MDRAHRLGQRRTVNVYRLLTRGTLEERIMGLQRFKLDVAAAVVNADNASLASLDTSGLLDLFAPPGAPAPAPPAAGPAAGASGAAGGGADAGAAAAGGAGPPRGRGGRGVLEGLGELWDEAQYAEELSLDAFMSKLR
jgi:TATA-binding protein-associated factor